MDFQKILDSFVLLLIMGVLSRPFSLIGLILKEKRHTLKDVCVTIFLCLCSFAMAFMILSAKYEYSFPNLFVETMAELFIAYCLFTPFEQLYLYMRGGIKNGGIKLSTIIAYVVSCVFVVILDAMIKS